MLSIHFILFSQHFLVLSVDNDMRMLTSMNG